MRDRLHQHQQLQTPMDCELDGFIQSLARGKFRRIPSRQSASLKLEITDWRERRRRGHCGSSRIGHWDIRRSPLAKAWAYREQKKEQRPHAYCPAARID